MVCIGAMLVDECFTGIENFIPGTSNPATYFRSSGGVAGNIANHLALLGQNVELITHFGEDTDGKWLIEKCRENGVGISDSIINKQNTGRYVALLNPSGELYSGAMTGYFDTVISIAFLEKKISLLKSASILQIDCNLSIDCLKWLLEFSESEKIPCVVEPVSIPKANKLKHLPIKNVLLLTPNYEEMAAICNTTGKNNADKLIEEILSRGVKNLWVRNGKNGSTIYNTKQNFELTAPKVNVIDTTGAGDAALGGWIYAWMNNKSQAECLLYGHSMASLILDVKGAIKNDLTSEILENTVKNYK